MRHSAIAAVGVAMEMEKLLGLHTPYLEHAKIMSIWRQSPSHFHEEKMEVSGDKRVWPDTFVASVFV